MKTIWKDIAPQEAEFRLHRLTRRMQNLLEALETEEAMLDARPDGDPSRLGLRSLLDRKAALEDDFAELLQHRVAEVAD